jgi:hypothetical protein
MAELLPEMVARTELFAADCPNCGSFQQSPPGQFAGVCNACASPLNFLPQSKRSLKPEGILPATVTREAAYAAFRKWTRRKLFAPHRLRSKEADDLKLHYEPLFVFSGSMRVRYSGERGRKVGKGDKRHTSWASVKGTVRWSLSPTAVEVGSGAAVKCSTSDWPADEAVGLRDEYLLGATARSYQSSPKAAQALIDDAVQKQSRALARKDIGGEQQRINTLNVEYESLDLSYVLGPLWTSAFYDNGKTFPFRVNGRTGKTVGRYPKSKSRIITAVAAAVAIVVLAVIGYQNTQHHDAVLAARSSVCSDISAVWADLYPYEADSPSAQGLAQLPTTDSYNYDALRSDAATAGNQYKTLAQSFVADQASDNPNAAASDAEQIASACQADGNGELVTNVTTATNSPPPGG